MARYFSKRPTWPGGHEYLGGPVAARVALAPALRAQRAPRARAPRHPRDAAAAVPRRPGMGVGVRVGSEGVAEIESTTLG